MTLLRRERDSNRRSLSSESVRARLAPGGDGIRTVSPSPVRVGLFAACGKFAAWLDLFMTPWWRERDSNSRSRLGRFGAATLLKTINDARTGPWQRPC